MQHFGPGTALEWHVTLIHVPCSFESFVRMYQPHPSLVPLHLQHFLEPLSHCLDLTLFVPRLPMAIFWNRVQICWPHPFLVSLTPVAMFWIPSLNILTSFSVPPPEESTFQSIPTLWHLFRSIPIEMPHPHPAAFLFKCPSRHRAALFQIHSCSNTSSFPVTLFPNQDKWRLSF